MKLRSHMVVYGVEPDRNMLYVLVEGAAQDCAVYMRSWPATTQVSEYQLTETMTGGGKVSIRDIDALPFRIPSDLTYRA